MDTDTQTRRQPWANGRGFAALPPERRREIARKGGKRGHEMGVAHRWTAEEAARAGKIGGRKSRRPKGNVESLTQD